MQLGISTSIIIRDMPQCEVCFTEDHCWKCQQDVCEGCKAEHRCVEPAPVDLRHWYQPWQPYDAAPGVNLMSKPVEHRFRKPWNHQQVAADQLATIRGSSASSSRDHDRKGDSCQKPARCSPNNDYHDNANKRALLDDVPLSIKRRTVTQAEEYNHKRMHHDVPFCIREKLTVNRTEANSGRIAAGPTKSAKEATTDTQRSALRSDHVAGREGSGGRITTRR